jgi:hypothetical protein
VSQAAAADTEIRDFLIMVDGNKAGSYRMTIGQPDANGFITMTGNANVRLKYLLYKYTYTYDGKEIWKDGMLQSFASTCNDNGKDCQVTVRPEGRSLRVKIVRPSGQQEYLAQANLWLSSYWRLPPAKSRNAAVPLMDADTGKAMNAELRYIGLEQVVVAGQRQNCYHFRVTGTPSPVDLWYDAKERLVRQEYLDDGHRTILAVTGIHR